MPPSLKNVNWPAIAAGIAAEETVETLAVKYGVKACTIRQRARREGWNKKTIQHSKNQANSSFMPVTKTVSRAVTEAMATQRERFLAAGGQVAMDGMEKLATQINDASDLDQLASIGAVGESFTKIAKPIFGLNDGQAAQTHMDINFLMSLPPEQVFLGLAKPVNDDPLR